MSTVSARIDKKAKDALDEIAWINRDEKSKLIVRAVTHYLAENPDDMVIPEPELQKWLNSVPVDPSSHE